MTALWALIEPRVGDVVVDPMVRRLLESVQTAESELEDELHPMGAAAVDDLVGLVTAQLPIPPGFDLLPAVPPIPDGVTARRIGATGWEVAVALPPISLGLPSIVKPGTIVDDGHGRKHVEPVAGSARMVVGGGATPAQLLITSQHGADVTLSLRSVSVALEPTVVAMPAGFGIGVGAFDVGPDGISLPGVTFYLPPLPHIPIAEVPCDISFRRVVDGAGALSGQVAGVFGHTSLALPPIADELVGVLDLTVDRPSGRSLADLIPTRVTFDLPLGGKPVALTSTKTVTPAPVAGEVSLHGSLTVAGDRVSVAAALEGGGTDRGIARIPGADIAVPGALGPYLPLPAGAVDAAINALLAAAALLGELAQEDGSDTTIQALRVEAAWSFGDAVPAAFDVALDYESQFAVDVQAGVRVFTRPGSPVRIRHRNVSVTLDPVPSLSWQGATSTLVSTGDWAVGGIPDDLLRVAGVRGGQGSVTIDLDLRVALELGLVTVDQATIRLRLGSGLAVEPAGFGVRVDVPGVVEGRGQLSFPPGGGGFGAALAVRLPTIGASGQAIVVVNRGMVVVGVRVALFTPIPFANSGLGLYGVGGAFAASAGRNLPPGDGITQELAWNPLDLDAWKPGSQVFIGFDAQIGTVPDLGFAFMANAGLLFALPDPLIRIVLEAQLLRGIGGALKGVIVVDEHALTVALEGTYGIPHLLSATVPAGARFPFADLTAWHARLGGDRFEGRGEPMTIHILPDLLDLEAWGFVMAFGSADTVAGSLLAPPGIRLDGLSLAFGAGVEIHWAAGPFSFEASGVVMAAITHQPPKTPDARDRPWLFAGFARIEGSVDLGPVSIGADAQLDVLLIPEDGVFYGHARACASIDLWLTEIEGCVEFDIGSKPGLTIPVPASPLLGLSLTDRLGTVVGAATEHGASAPTVWPDTIPVLTFSHWVAEASPLAGVAGSVGNATPANGGWLGTRKLEYRFELRAVHTFEVAPDGTEVEIGTGMHAAWQLPLTANVFGSTTIPADARALALNHVDPFHWLQPAVGAGVGTPGDPIAVLGRLCLPLPGAAATWFAGVDARVPDAGPMTVPPSTPARHDVDLADVTVWIDDQVEGRLPVDGTLSLAAAAAGAVEIPPYVEAWDPVDLDGRLFPGVCWLPRILHGDEAAGIRISFSQPATDVVIHLASVDNGIASVSDPDHGGWASAGTVQSPSGSSVERFASPAGARVEAIDIRIGSGVNPVGLVAISAVSVADQARASANEVARRTTHETLEAAAGRAGTPRGMLKPGTTYRVAVDLAWSGRGDGYASSSDNPMQTRTFTFRTAAKAAHPPPAPLGGGLVTFDLMVATSLMAMQQFAESELQGGDLARYVGGVIPADGTQDHFTGDPVQVLFTVDHLPDLALVYDDHLSVVVRRTDAPPGTPPDHAAPQVVAVPPPPPGEILIAPLVAPLLVSHLSHLDQRRAAFVTAQEASDDPCRIRRPGAVVQPPFVLDPHATYRLVATIDPAPPGELPAERGVGPVIVETTFMTSRYGSGLELLADLGLQPAGDPPAIPAIPLPVDVSDQLLALCAPGEDVGARFEAALGILGLGGYEAPVRARTSVLWARLADGSWRVAGALLESPEPIRRPGRLDVGEVRLGGVRLAARFWDSRGTRLLALATPFEAPGSLALELDARDWRPGQPDPGVRTVRGIALAAAPAMAEVLA